MALFATLVTTIDAVQTIFRPTTVLRNGNATFILLNILAFNAVLDESSPVLHSTRLPDLYKLSPVVCLYDISTHLASRLRRIRLEDQSEKGKRWLPPQKEYNRPWNAFDAVKLLLRLASILVAIALFISFDDIPFSRLCALTYGMHSLLASAWGQSSTENLDAKSQKRKGVSFVPFVAVAHLWASATQISHFSPTHWVIFLVSGALAIATAHRLGKDTGKESLFPSYSSTGPNTAAKWVYTGFMFASHQVLLNAGCIQIALSTNPHKLLPPIVYIDMATVVLLSTLSAPVPSLRLHAIFFAVVTWTNAFLAYCFAARFFAAEPYLGPSWANF